MIDQALAFAIIGGMMVMFVWNRFRYDLVALLGLLIAVACGIVPVEKAFAGFSDSVVIIVASVLVISAGVGKSNAIGRIIRRLQPHMQTTGGQVLVLTSGVTIMSAFMKNIGALAILLPIALQVARRSGTAPSKLLMPMAFGSLIGGLVTLVGTSPNILVSRVRAELLGEPFGMFDFAPVGLGVVVAGLAFLAVGWRLLPGERRAQASAAAAFEVQPYVFEAVLPATSPSVKKTVADLEAIGEGNVAVVAIIRGKNTRYTPAKHSTLLADDILVLQGDPHTLRTILEEGRLHLGGDAAEPTTDKHRGNLGVVEAVVMRNSPLVGRASTELKLRDRYNISLIGISRQGQAIATDLRHVRFQPSDVLILQGTLESMPETLKTLDCLPLVDRAIGLGRRRQEFLPLILMALAMVSVALNWLPVTTAFFGAAVLVVLFGVLTLREAYEAIELPILVLLACLIPISDSISSTGGAELIANGLAAAAAALPPVGAMSLALVTAMVLTPFLNNAATVLIMAPVGASLAEKLGLHAEPFLMAVALGAACDFLTPIGHQCNTLVMGPGGYRFGDYWRLGLPLSIIVIIVGTILIPLFWPLK